MARKVRTDRYVSRFVRANGTERYRFRKDGRSVYLPHPKDPGYRDAYEAALRGAVNDPGAVVPRSVEDLVRRFYRTPGWVQVSDGRKANLRSVMEPFRQEHRDILVRYFTFEHIEAILLQRAMKQNTNGRLVGGPHAAQRLRKQLTKMFDLAVKLEWISINPVRLAEKVKAPVKGYHIWAEAEIIRYQDRHIIGTKARAALEIMLWTFQRLGDARLFGPRHLKDGRVSYTQSKTGKTLQLPAAPAMLEAIEALPATGIETFLVTDYGKPFSAAGFGNKMRQWCDEAGLSHCTAHGIRKAAATRLANLGGTSSQLKAMGGWSNDRQVATYTAGADQEALAERAMDLLTFG